jgi:hypothetical protein
MAAYEEKLNLWFMQTLVKSQKGRAYLYSMVADAESAGEGKVFEQLLKREDPELQRLATRHRDDEIRHAELMLDAVKRTGLEGPVIPEELKLIDKLDAELGGFFSKPIETREDVMRAYVLLQVIEERAMSQFGLYQRVLKDVDPETAKAFAVIEADEERHLRYCHAIAKRYAPSEAVHAETLRHIREVEARVFGANQGVSMRFVFANGAFAAPAPVRWAWMAIGALSRLLNPSRKTKFFALPPGEVMPRELSLAGVAG